MAFKPEESYTPKREFTKLPTPDGGLQSGRVALIVELGKQIQFYDNDKIGEDGKPVLDAQGRVVKVTEQGEFPTTELAVYIDLTDQLVDYGGDIGQKHYRLCANKSWNNSLTGAAFKLVPPRDADGKAIPNRLKTFHPNNLLSKLAKAADCEHILGKAETADKNGDVEELLGKPLMVEVKVDVRPDKQGRTNADGSVWEFVNVKAEKFTTLMRKGGKPIEVEELLEPAKLITFSNVTEADLKYLRKDVIEKIKKATNYKNSRYEALLGPVVETNAVEEKAESTEGSPDKEIQLQEEQQMGGEVSEGLDDFDELPF